MRNKKKYTIYSLFTGAGGFENGSTYEGEWVDDLMSGFGNLQLTSGEKYTGEFQNNLR